MQKELESLWQQCVAFHGHGCGGLAVGFRAVLYAWELFGGDRASQDEEIVCIAETDACGSHHHGSPQHPVAAGRHGPTAEQR